MSPAGGAQDNVMGDLFYVAWLIRVDVFDGVKNRPISSPRIGFALSPGARHLIDKDLLGEDASPQACCHVAMFAVAAATWISRSSAGEAYYYWAERSGSKQE